MSLFKFKKKSRDMTGIIHIGRKKHPIASALPQSTSLQTQRIKQIESMRDNLSNLEEILKGSEYLVHFSVHGTKYSLYIHLPQAFPSDSPIAQIRPYFNHPWIDQTTNTITGYEPLNVFRMHDNLGKTIASLVREFTSYRVQTQDIYSSSPSQYVHNNTIQSYIPIPHIGSPDLATGRYSNSPPSKDVPITHAHTVPITHAHAVPITHAHAVPITHAHAVPLITEKEFQHENVIDQPRNSKWIKYDLLDQLSEEEMKKIVDTNDDSVLLPFIDFDGLHMDAQNKRVKHLQENLKLAEENLEYKPRYDELTSILEQQQSQEKALLSDFKNYSKEQARLGEFSEFKIIQSLEQLSEQADKEADKFGDDFIKGNLEINCKSFVQQFLVKREVNYMRKLKIQKVNRLLSDEKGVLFFEVIK